MANLYDKSSLVMIPSGKKDGTVFSQKPVDGSGDFTFSRGSNLAATRVGADGLIEKGRENLILQSNNFSTTWSPNNASVTSGHAGYDGSSDAWLLSKSGAGGFIQQTKSQSGVVTQSIYVKANTSTWCYMLNGSGFRYFDLANGVIGNGGADIDSSIEAVGATGWYRISLVTNGCSYFRLYPAEANSNAATSGSIYIQDAQVEIGLAATEVITTGATTGKAGLLEDEPRFDYSGGATCPSLLLEPSRTNLIRYSEYYGSNLLINSSIDINNTTSPEGVQNATLLIENTSSGNHALREAANTGLAGDDSQYVISFYAKSNGRNIRFIDDAYAGSSTIVDFNITSGGTLNNGFLVIDSDAVSFGDGWYYCYAVIDKASATQTSFRFSLRLLGGASNNNDSYTGDGTSGAWIWGKQIEDAVTYPTSYIPNHSGGTITRGLDAMNNSSLGLTDCTFFVDFVPLSSVMGLLDFYDNSNAMIFYIAINSVKYLQFNGVQGGTIGSVLGPLTIGDRYKLAFTLNASTGDVTIFVNGTKYGTYSTTISSLNKIFQVSSFGYYNNTEFNQILTFGEILSDADCITLTTI